MSGQLLDAVLAQVRVIFSRDEVLTVEEYGGQFDATEVSQASFSCPAVFVAILGWRPMKDSTRLTGKHLRQYRLAAFVVTKHPKRELRMRQAMLIADKLGLGLKRWVPDAGPMLNIGALEDEATAENLYSRAIDTKGLALWLVDWRQCTQPGASGPEQVYDLVSIELADLVHQGRLPAPAAPPPPAILHPVTVTADIKFDPVLPSQ